MRFGTGAVGQAEGHRDPQRRADHGVGDAGVPGGGVEQPAPVLEQAAAQGVLHHGEGRPVLHRPARVGGLRLGVELHPRPADQRREVDQGRIADQLEQPHRPCRSRTGDRVREGESGRPHGHFKLADRGRTVKVTKIGHKPALLYPSSPGGISAEEETMDDSIRTGTNRVPPGQYVTEKWPVLTYGRTPDDRARAVDAPDLRPGCRGEGRSPGRSSRLCPGCGFRPTSTASPASRPWTTPGRAWRRAEVLRHVQVDPEASHVLVHCYGGYTTNLPLEDFLSERALFADTPQRPAAARSTTAGRCDWWCPTSTPGRAPSG